ncbi:MAG: valine--tRNA ligase [Gammaproteobacteria bacterium]|jgi:valyl-tRNA synthetase|nr:valine--tRNA ligase [Gammaproteobacteria bacterium]MBT3860010.1 valine--tRNA ligase [Gammaproteobacteria bacterium]MBT3987040.1 valine--tRNA ligase [Gammaproteobacteria bacterium]MBT4256973.1 valine--tRNA ligase [Gammaproteobacteria bacterium]MBT4580695.1 valine--tRNA ligase [Gammaproteobacteria bacterium]
MDKTYQPQQIEDQWYKTWEDRGYFAPQGDGEPYCIVIPPPNVTGRLHMGHGFQHSLMDALTRYHRMLGRAALWQVGTDHAGIATQMVVERKLNAAGSSRQEIGREDFVKKVWNWKEESGGIITQQIRRLGSSLDWSRERFTMDEQLSKVVEKVFIDLYEEGLIYRGNRLVNWDPDLHTAVSDLEVISEEEDGFLWHFKYPLSDDKTKFITIATTRPETLLGDSAIAVHPEDERYAELVGKFVDLPLCDRQIPVIADEYVDPEFGTGCVKITPAHDFNDYEVGKRHDLEIINILTNEAAINENAPEIYQGMDRFDARKKVVADMEALGLLEKIDPHKLKVPRGDRSGVIIEPYLTHQWYVAIQSLADPAIKAVEDGDIEFVPKNWENTYFAWMRNIQDWCISRQLWWGHRIPAWYDEEGNVYVGKTETEARSKNGLADDLPLRQDEDVLDTWFSSALWTFSTLGWPDDREFFDRFHPTDVLVTGFDIIFFWVARMIMMTLKFTGEIPFKKVYITGLIKDEHGDKMSKSKGNILDPIDIIDGIELEELVEKRTADMMQPQLKAKIDKLTRDSYPEGIAGYGTDALRYTFYSLASTGRDINFDLGRTEGYRNFCNKIWNAARYVMMNAEDKKLGAADSSHQSIADKWIISRFEQTAKSIEESMENYRFDLASQTLHEFIWNEYCDWYVELSKPVLWDEDNNPEAAQATRYVLVSILEKSLRLLHPFMPFITEEIWQRVAPLQGIEGDSIMLQPYPVFSAENVDDTAEQGIEWIKGVIIGIRNIRGEMDISPAKAISVFLRKGDETDQARLESYRLYLIKLAKLESIEWLGNEQDAPPAATQLHGNLEILVPMAGLIDTEAERARLKKEIAKLESGLKAVGGKLSNAKFVDNAPEAVVEKERGKQAKMESALTALSQKLEQLDDL